MHKLFVVLAFGLTTVSPLMLSKPTEAAIMGMPAANRAAMEQHVSADKSDIADATEDPVATPVAAHMPICLHMPIMFPITHIIRLSWEDSMTTISSVMAALGISEATAASAIPAVIRDLEGTALAITTDKATAGSFDETPMISQPTLDEATPPDNALSVLQMRYL